MSTTKIMWNSKWNLLHMWCSHFNWNSQTEFHLFFVLSFLCLNWMKIWRDPVRKKFTFKIPFQFACGLSECEKRTACSLFSLKRQNEEKKEINSTETKRKIDKKLAFRPPFHGRIHNIPLYFCMKMFSLLWFETSSLFPDEERRKQKNNSLCTRECLPLRE